MRVSMLQQTNSKCVEKQETLTQFFNKSIPTYATQPVTLTQAGPSNSETSSKPNHENYLHEGCKDYGISFEECFTDPILEGGKGTGSPTVPVCDSDTAVCPVCNCEISVDNILFNRHIDECLNRTAIQQAHTDTSATTAAITEKSSLKNSSLHSKVGHNSPATKTGKKRRNNEQLLNDAKKHRTLDSFWKQ